MKTIQEFAALLEEQQRVAFARDYASLYAANLAETEPRPPTNPLAWKVKVTPGNKYTKVDVGSSGKYMVDNATGAIFGIKAYGCIHKGHSYGTLQTTHEWDWSGYTAAKLLKSEIVHPV